jgi:hypothetical protein
MGSSNVVSHANENFELHVVLFFINIYDISFSLASTVSLGAYYLTLVKLEVPDFFFCK